MKLRTAEILCVLGLLAGCSSGKKPKVSSSSTANAANSEALAFEQEAVQAQPHPSDKAPKPLTRDAAPSLKSQRLIPLSFGADGFPKVRRYYREKEGQQKSLERIESDFNGDGRVDFIEWYDVTGQFVERESADLDGNGRMNAMSFYKKVLGQEKRELIKQEFDAKFEGKTSVWKYFLGGRLLRREIDRRGTGKPDYWEYYEQGKLVRIEKDENADGSPDSEPNFKQVVKPQSPEPLKNKAPAP